MQIWLNEWNILNPLSFLLGQTSWDNLWFCMNDFRKQKTWGESGPKFELKLDLFETSRHFFGQCWLELDFLWNFKGTFRQELCYCSQLFFGVNAKLWIIFIGQIWKLCEAYTARLKAP